MYKNLVEIGLKKYLDEYFFNKSWSAKSYLEKLDSYVGALGIEQKEILNKKYSKISNHRSINDHFYELMVGYVFHQSGIYPDDNIFGGSPDIIDGNVLIEVKAINAPATEIERVKIIVPDSVSWGPFADDKDFESRFKEKFDFRVDKAKEQISNKGLIYIIWDSTLKGWTSRRSQIEILLKMLGEDFESSYPEIKIKSIYFGDLIEMVDTRDVTGIESEKT